MLLSCLTMHARMDAHTHTERPSELTVRTHWYYKHNFSKASIARNTKISTHHYYVCKAMSYLYINCQIGSYD